MAAYTAAMNLALEGLNFPVRILPVTPVTSAELVRLSSANKGLRIERERTGELVIMTPTGNRTGRKSLYIGRMLGNWADEDGRGYAFDSSTGFSLLDGSMRSPDAAWVKSSRWDTLTEQEKDEFSPICPEFIIELRSPTDSLSALQDKMNVWLANGAELAWLIDPSRKAVEIYRPNQSPETIEGTSYVEGEGPVAGFVLELARIWA